MPGALKNALDWASRPFPAIGAPVIDRDLPVSRAQEAFDSSGCLGDDEQQAVLGEIVATLIAAARCQTPEFVKVSDT